MKNILIFVWAFVIILITLNVFVILLKAKSPKLQRSEGSFIRHIVDEIKCQYHPASIGFGGCMNCGRKWSYVEGHDLDIKSGSSTFAICEGCFKSLGIKDIAYYLKKHLKGHDEKYANNTIFRACLDKFPYVEQFYENENKPDSERKPIWLRFDDKEQDEALAFCAEIRKNISEDFKRKPDFQKMEEDK